MYYTDQAAELAAQSAAVEDPTLRDALAPEDMPTILREPLEPVAPPPTGDRTPQPVGRGQPMNHAQATLKLPIDPTRWSLCCALRDQCPGKVLFVCAQCRLSGCEMNEVTLGKAPAAAMCDVTHAHQQFGAASVITTRECEQCLAGRL